MSDDLEYVLMLVETINSLSSADNKDVVSEILVNLESEFRYLDDDTKVATLMFLLGQVVHCRTEH